MERATVVDTYITKREDLMKVRVIKSKYVEQMEQIVPAELLSLAEKRALTPIGKTRAWIIYRREDGAFVKIHRTTLYDLLCDMWRKMGVDDTEERTKAWDQVQRIPQLFED